MKSIKELIEIRRKELEEIRRKKMIKIEYFEAHKLKKQKKWEEEFNKEYKRIMREVYADRRRIVRNNCVIK